MDSALVPAAVVALCLLVFSITHVGLTTERTRARLVAALGPLGFGILYSAIAFVGFGALVHVYARLQAAGAAGLPFAELWPVRALGISLVVAGIVLATASFFSPPASTLALAFKGSRRRARGLERVTRHPFFAGTVMLGLGHALVAQRLVGTVAFGGLALMTVVGAMHQDRKLARHLGPSYVEYLSETSFVPFAAILAGRQRLLLAEIPWIGLAVSIAVAFLLRSVHSSILARDGLWAMGVLMLGVVAATMLTWLGRRRKRAAGPKEGARAIAQR